MSQELILINSKLENFLEREKKSLPDNFNVLRFKQNCMAVVRENKNIASCDPASVARTFLKGAILNLDFFLKECHAIAYKGILQFQTDYKGELKLAKKYSIEPIEDIYSMLVREGDNFEEKVVNSKKELNFQPKPFNQGKIIGAFAVVNFKSGSNMSEVMSIQEVHKLRDKSSKSYKFKKDGQSSIWDEHEGEMVKKTVLRRLLKTIPREFDSIEQNQIFNEASDFEFNKKEGSKITPPKRKSEIKPQEDIIEGEKIDPEWEKENQNNWG